MSQMYTEMYQMYTKCVKKWHFLPKLTTFYKTGENKPGTEMIDWNWQVGHFDTFEIFETFMTFTDI